MGKILNAYWAVLAITGVFAIIFRDDKKKFVISAAIIHTFVCGFRYDAMHGDLMVYKRTFVNSGAASWLSEDILNGGRNTLFYSINKLVANITNNNFQALLFVIAAISIISISIVIYKYSEMPYISYLMWSCFGFYMFGFYSIKQSLAMSFLMFASIAVFERKPIIFYILTIIAGFIHVPAFVFLPAYELCRVKKLSSIIRFYIILTVVVIVFRNQIVVQMAELYYEGDKYAAVESSGVGGKTLLMIALLVVGIFLCNMKNERYRYTYILIATASLLQMFSVYDNVFTRLADYYFQFIILYAPFILKQSSENLRDIAIMNFNEQSRILLTIGFVALAMMFYYRVNFMHASPVPVDNLVANFKFFWQ